MTQKTKFSKDSIYCYSNCLGYCYYIIVDHYHDLNKLDKFLSIKILSGNHPIIQYYGDIHRLSKNVPLIKDAILISK